MKKLLHTIIFAVTVAFSCSSLAAHITKIHPNIDFGWGPVHVFVLSNGDVLEARPGEVERMVNPSAVGPAEGSADNWHAGDEIQIVTVKRLEWVTFMHMGGSWVERETSVAVNKTRGNSYLLSLRYTQSPSRTWKGGKVEDIGFTWPGTNERATWVVTNSDGLMAAHPGLKLEGWAKGDKIRFRQYESTHGTSWMLYNERTGIYAYPFWKVSAGPWTPASYQLLSLTEKDGNTILQLDRNFDLVVPTRKLKDRSNRPLFKVGDFVVVKVKKQTQNQGFGIAIVQPNAGEEVMARAANTYRGYPGYWNLSGLDADGTFTITDNPFRLKLNNAADYAKVDNFSSVVVAVNATHNGLVLLNGEEIWYYSNTIATPEQDEYTVIPLDSAQWSTGGIPSQVYEGIFPNLTAN